MIEGETELLAAVARIVAAFQALGVLKVQATSLDRSYLDHWAGELGVTALLRRALNEAGLTEWQSD